MIKLVYARAFSDILPTYHATDNGPDLIHSASRIGSVPVVDDEGRDVLSELILIEAEQAVHDIIGEWPGYEMVASLEVLDGEE